jgi:hypothetical protein
MTATVTLEVPVEHEALLRRTLALAEELHQLALSAPDGTVFDACETAVIADGRKLQQQLLQEVVARRIEAAEKKGAAPCLHLWSPQRKPRPQKRQLVSALGVLTIQRRYWKCRCGTTVGSYAADEILGLNGRYRRTVQQHACRLGADQSFALAQEHLREMLDVRVSAETLRTLAESHGQAMQRFQRVDEETAAAFQKAPGEVEFTVDAGKVNTREEGWKDLKIGVIQKRESAAPASPAGWDQQRLPRATIVLAFALIATSKDFRRSWRSRLRQLGVRSCASVQVLADGASWIWKSVQRILTGCVQTLDF